MKNLSPINENTDLVDKEYVDGKVASIPAGSYYGYCETAAATFAKVVTIEGFPSTLVAGMRVTIKFKYASANTDADNPMTLNVSGTGAKVIYRYGTTLADNGTTTTGWIAGAVQTFTYDGNGWVREYWANSTYSNASLGQGYATCATAAATTAKVATLSSYSLAVGGVVAVKFTYDVPASATLNVNSKGAKAIYHRGAAIKAGIIKGGDIATFIYSTYYHLISIDRAGVGVAGVLTSGAQLATLTIDGVSTAIKVNSAAVTSALGFTPFDSASFTKASIKSTLGIADWALAATPPVAETAKKLATARTLWGQSFDGSANVSGTITGTYFQIRDTTNPFYKLTVGNYINYVQMTSDGIAYFGSTSMKSLSITQSGTVGIVENLNVTGKVTASGLNVTTPNGSVSYTDNILNVNASLKIYSGWLLRLGANATGISEWTDLKSILGLGSLAYKSSLTASDIPSLSWSKITSGKPTTLSGYGITDAVVWSDNINVSSNNSFKHIGSANANNGWPSVGGPAMAFGASGSNYVKVVFPNANEYYQQRIYFKHVKNGVTAANWEEILTKNNFGDYGMAFITADSDSDGTRDLAPTDTRNFFSYAYGDLGWKVAGPSMSFGAPQYKGLFNFGAYDPTSVDNGVSAYIAIAHTGNLSKWSLILTEHNLGSRAMLNKPLQSGVNLDDLTDAGSYGLASGLTNHPSFGYGTLLVFGPSNYDFRGQIAIEANGTSMCYRSKSDILLNDSYWRSWKKIVDDANIGDYAILRTGGTMTAGAGIYNAANSNKSEGAIGFNSNHNAFGSTTFPTKIRSSVDPTVKLPSAEYTIVHTGNAGALSIGALRVVSQTATSGTVTISPNVLNKWSSALTGTLTIQFAAETSGVANYYMIEFPMGTTVRTVKLPSGLTWMGGDNILSRLEVNKTYQISVLNNLAVGGAF